MRWGQGEQSLTEWSLPRLKAQFILDALADLPENARVLDYGCGEGRMILTLRRHRPDLRVYGCDIQRPARVTFPFTTVERDEPPSEIPNSLDAIILEDVLEHTTIPTELIPNLMRLIVPGGRIILIVPVEGTALSPHSVMSCLLGADLFRQTKGHIQAFTRAGIKVLIDGYQITRSRHLYHALGSLLDACYFALHLIPSISVWHWERNSTYHPETKRHGPNLLLELANALAYWESRILSRCSIGATTWMMVVQK